MAQKLKNIIKLPKLSKNCQNCPKESKNVPPKKQYHHGCTFSPVPVLTIRTILLLQVRSQRASLRPQRHRGKTPQSQLRLQLDAQPCPGCQGRQEIFDRKISLLNVSSMDPNSTTPSASHCSSSSSSKQLSHASRRLHCPAISDQIVFVCRNKPHFCYSPALPPPTEFVRRRGIGSPGQYICTAVNITVLLLSVCSSQLRIFCRSTMSSWPGGVLAAGVILECDDSYCGWCGRTIHREVKESHIQQEQ